MEEPSYETNLHLRPNTTTSLRRRSRDGSLDNLHDIPASGTEAEKKHIRRVSRCARLLTCNMTSQAKYDRVGR